MNLSGTNNISVNNIREILILMISVVILTWFGTNYPAEFERARIFWWLGLVSLSGIAMSFIIKHPALDFNMPLAEGANLFKVNKKIVGLIALILFIVTFFLISTTQYSLYVPGLQIVDLGLTGNALVVIAGAIQEDFFFFSFLFGLVFTIAYYFSRNQWVAFIVCLFTIPMIFMLYHVYVKGLSDIVGMIAVYIFGVEMIIWWLLLGDLLITHARHVGNNLGKLVFTHYNLPTFFIVLLSSPLTWIILIIIGIIILYKIIK